LTDETFSESEIFATNGELGGSSEPTMVLSLLHSDPFWLVVVVDVVVDATFIAAVDFIDNGDAILDVTLIESLFLHQLKRTTIEIGGGYLSLFLT
jgi:hypothetical protein